MSEEETRRVINVYREEHETWNVDRIMSLFADEPVWQSGIEPPIVGRAAFRARVEQMAAIPAKRRMRHLREIIQGSEAAVEWQTDHLAEDGTWRPWRLGVNLYEFEEGKIKSIRLYAFLAEGAR